jgi:hypothetical protein
MSEKQKLLLYLIANYPFLGSIYQLVKLFDRADFPGNVSPHLEHLHKNGMIEVDKVVGNSPISYRPAKKGAEYVKGAVHVGSLILYVKTFDYPDQLLIALKVEDDTEQRTT